MLNSTWLGRDKQLDSKGPDESRRQVLGLEMSSLGICMGISWGISGHTHTHTHCYASRQTYVEVKDTYSEGGTHEETLRPRSKARIVNKRRGD